MLILLRLGRVLADDAAPRYFGSKKMARTGPPRFSVACSSAFALASSRCRPALAAGRALLGEVEAHLALGDLGRADRPLDVLPNPVGGHPHRLLRPRSV